MTKFQNKLFWRGGGDNIKYRENFFYKFFTICLKIIKKIEDVFWGFFTDKIHQLTMLYGGIGPTVNRPPKPQKFRTPNMHLKPIKSTQLHIIRNQWLTAAILVYINPYV